MMADFAGLYNYWIFIILMMIGFYIVMAQHNLIKKVVGVEYFSSISLRFLYFYE